MLLNEIAGFILVNPEPVHKKTNKKKKKDMQKSHDSIRKDSSSSLTASLKGITNQQ